MEYTVTPEAFMQPDQNKLQFKVEPNVNQVKFYYDPALTSEFITATKLKNGEFSIDLTTLKQNVLCNVGFIQFNDNETVAYRCQFEKDHYILRVLK